MKPLSAQDNTTPSGGSRKPDALLDLDISKPADEQQNEDYRKELVDLLNDAMDQAKSGVPPRK